MCNHTISDRNKPGLKLENLDLWVPGQRIPHGWVATLTTRPQPRKKNITLCGPTDNETRNHFTKNLTTGSSNLSYDICIAALRRPQAKFSIITAPYEIVRPGNT